MQYLFVIRVVPRRHSTPRRWGLGGGWPELRPTPRDTRAPISLDLVGLGTPHYGEKLRQRAHPLPADADEVDAPDGVRRRERGAGEDAEVGVGEVFEAAQREAGRERGWDRKFAQLTLKFIVF